MTKQVRSSEDVKSEIIGIVLVTMGILSIFSLIYPSSGMVSKCVNSFLKSTTGEGRYLLPIFLILAGVRLISKRNKFVVSERTYGAAILCLVVFSFLHLLIPLEDSFKAGVAGDGGGVLGAALSYVLRKSFGIFGTYIILFTASLVAFLLLTNFSLATVAGKFAIRAREILKKGFHGAAGFLFTEAKEEKADITPSPVIVKHEGEQFTIFDSSATAKKQEVRNDFASKDLSVSLKKKGSTSNIKILGNSYSEVQDNDETLSSFDQDQLSENPSYKLPSFSILSRPYRVRNVRLNKDISENIRILEETMESFGVKAKVIQVSRGPAITRYEIQPPSGVKVSRIVSLADDIALSMAAPGVRIEAPIPGKAAVGIEVPNKEISMVHLRELLETQEFIRSGSKLTIALGKDIAGNPVVADLAKMHHLLIAGATGSGKSVCLNTLIASMLFKATPEQVKFLIIDPKMVELTTYNGIPHLISPVVTDPKKAAEALRWVVRKMERRYELFATTGVRDIARYNKIFKNREKDSSRLLPLIVVIIDELADLMMVAPADVEDAVCRLAQMARAAGIHLVVATQRPSVDVITGLIKANIPSRISFAVSSQIDSRTILDTAGAEKLLGKGDMLFLPVGATKPLRVQGAYLSDREVEDLVSYLKKQAKPVYEEKMLAETSREENYLEMEDELLPKAVHILIEAGHASISMLQRRLHIGYARAARLIDIMEKRGIVGGYEGSKPRAILMTLDQFNQIFKREK